MADANLVQHGTAIAISRTSHRFPDFPPFPTYLVPLGASSFQFVALQNARPQLHDFLLQALVQLIICCGDVVLAVDEL